MPPWSLECDFFSVAFIGVTLVNKTIQVSGVQFYVICTLYYVLTTPSQVPFHHHLSPHTLFFLLSLLFPTSNHHTVVCKVFS